MWRPCACLPVRGQRRPGRRRRRRCHLLPVQPLAGQHRGHLKRAHHSRHDCAYLDERAGADDHAGPPGTAATPSTARPRSALRAAFEAFEADAALRVAVLTGAGGHFCAGADLQALGDPAAPQRRRARPARAPGPMGPTRMAFTQAGDRRGRRLRGGRRAGTGADVRPARGRAQRRLRRVLPALGRAADRRRHRAAAAHRRPGPRAGPDPHRPRGGGRRGAGDGPGQPRRRRRPGAGRGAGAGARRSRPSRSAA